MFNTSRGGERPLESEGIGSIVKAGCDTLSGLRLAPASRRGRNTILVPSGNHFQLSQLSMTGRERQTVNIRLRMYVAWDIQHVDSG